MTVNKTNSMIHNLFGLISDRSVRNGLFRRLENHEKIALTLAFAVCISDENDYLPKLNVIADWISQKAETDLEKNKTKKTLNKALSDFKKCKRINIHKLCTDLNDSTKPSQRYKYLQLLLDIIAADGIASKKELQLIQKISCWLDIDKEKFRTMAEKIIPLNIHEQKDLQLSLGIEPNMNTASIIKQLNSEYRKWNSRVTSSSKTIRELAEYMLDFITQTRDQYTIPKNTS